MNTKEIWRDIPGHRDFQASNMGRVRRSGGRGHGRRIGHIYVGAVEKKTGYITVTVGGKRARVHRLVALAFHGKPKPGQIALHYNDNPADNRAGNLRWGTRAENVKDAIRNGRIVLATECARGHDMRPGSGNRDARNECRTCSNARKRAWKERQRAKRATVA